MKIIWLLLLVISLGCSAFAQRTVRNGGGLAELNIIYLNQNLAKITLACLNLTNPCAITDIEAKELELIAQNQDLEANESKISFSESFAPNDLFQTKSKLGSAIIFNRSYLYDDQGLPKPKQILAALVLAARLTHVSNRTVNELLNFALRLTSFISEDTKILIIEPTMPQILFYATILHLKSGSLSLLLIEDQKSSLDITLDVKKLLANEYLESFVVENMRSFLRDQQFTVLIDLVNLSEAQRKSYTLKINFYKNSENLIEQKSVILELFK